jgi:hypothetical protein
LTLFACGLCALQLRLNMMSGFYFV